MERNEIDYSGHELNMNSLIISQIILMVTKYLF